MNKELIQIKFDYLDILSVQLTIEDTVSFLEKAQKILQKKKHITEEQKNWLVNNMYVSVRYLNQELEEIRRNGKFVFAPNT